LDSFTNVMDVVIDSYGLHEEDVLICHDSVRPFVTQQMINDCIDATLEDNFALTVWCLLQIPSMLPMMTSS
jgi:2-C-methyl-D-erythritol 4-phosphate cytidylyltransferase